MIPRRPDPTARPQNDAPKRFTEHRVLDIIVRFPMGEFNDTLFLDKGDKLDRGGNQWEVVKDGREVTIDIRKAYWWSTCERTHSVEEPPFAPQEGK